MSVRQGPTSPCKGEVGREAAGRGSNVRRFSRTSQMTERARRLRANMTDAEQKPWRALRRAQIGGVAFRRQHPVGPFTLDFYCPTLRLAIEVDGGQHSEDMGRRKDKHRTAWLASQGTTVLRFWNNDVLANLSGVLNEVNRVTIELAAQRSTPSPTLPLSGGGRTGGTP